MMRRCYNETQAAFANYGGLGVKVAPEWHDFAVFFRDMGNMPAGMTIERVDPLKGYSASNCIWLPRRLQQRNKTTTRWLTFGGEKLCLAEWAERLGIKPKTLRARIDDHGWSVARALTTPVQPIKKP